MHNAINRMILSKGIKSLGLRVKRFLPDKRFFYYICLPIIFLFLCQKIYSTNSILILIPSPIFLFINILAIIIVIYVFYIYKKLEEGYNQLEYFDVITGLPNQRSFIKKINTILKQIVPS